MDDPELPEDFPDELREMWRKTFRKTWFDRVFWDKVLPYSNWWSAVCLMICWGFAAGYAVAGHWGWALVEFVCGTGVLWAVWAKHRNQRAWQDQIDLMNAAIQIERPDPS